MALSLAGANTKQINREKLSHLGQHVLQIVDVREDDTRDYGRGFFMELKVVSGPSPKGSVVVFTKFPEAAKASNGYSAADIRAKDLGAMQLAVAAAYGLGSDQVDQINDAIYHASLSTEVVGATPAKKSPLVGRLVIGNNRSHTAKKAPFKVSTILDILPYVEGFEADATGAAVGGSALVAPAGALVPSIPALPTTPKVFPPAGWAAHPETPGFFYTRDEAKALNGQQVASEADLRAA